MIRRTTQVLTALVAALLATMVLTAPAGANYTEGNDIDLRVVNNSSTGITAAYCPRGHVSTHYIFGTTHDPCNVTPFVTHISGHGDRYQSYKAPKLGVILRAAHHQTQYFYLRNPSVGLPYMVVNGHTYRLVQGELKTVHVAGGTVRLHREGDRHGLKIMTIELIKMGAS
jgi:hypothetical protein